MWSSRLMDGSACDTLARLMKEIAYVTVANGRIRSQRCSCMKVSVNGCKLFRIIGQHRWFDEKHSAGYNNAGVTRILPVAPGIFARRNIRWERNSWRNTT